PGIFTSDCPPGSQHKLPGFVIIIIIIFLFLKLYYFLYRGLAVKCKPLQQGFDQLFTIYLNRGPDSLDEQNITFCGVQASDVELVQDNPYLVLLVSLKSQGEITPLPILPEDNRPASQVFPWFEEFCVSSY
ncbi:hypothetical protein VP01_8269g1, partial [Puccinia sorghi]